MNRVIQPKVKSQKSKVEVTLVQGEIFNVTIGRAASQKLPLITSWHRPHREHRPPPKLKFYRESAFYGDCVATAFVYFLAVVA
jgi:hypothetical protein